jgi:hypothetical protein
MNINKIVSLSLSLSLSDITSLVGFKFNEEV